MNDRLTVMIACLSRVAWADGQLLPEEADFFTTVIKGLKLPVETECKAWEAVVSPSADFDDADIEHLSDTDRRKILNISREMAASDGSISEEEKTAIEALAKRFDIREE